jgi:hypothetical protein
MFVMQEVGSNSKLYFYKYLLYEKKNQRGKAGTAGTAKLQIVLVPDPIKL